MKNEFHTTDAILGTLNLWNPTDIDIEITESSIILQIGQRDYEWDRETGELIHDGTLLGTKEEFDEMMKIDT